MAPRVRWSRVLVWSIAVAALVAGCTDGGLATLPAASLAPDRTVSPAAATTVAELTSVLGERSLIVTLPQQPYRPAEATTLAAAAREELQVQLPDDPGGGWVVVYELPSPDAAMAAAREQADWLGSGPGRVQTPIGTQHVIRVAGPTVVLYSWHPETAQDPRAAEIAEALGGFGVGVDVPA